MGAYNFLQGIVPLNVPYGGTFAPGNETDVTGMAFQRLFFRVRDWDLALTYHNTITGSDGFMNTTDATYSGIIVGPNNGDLVQPASEETLYRLTPFAIIFNSATTPILYNYFDSTSFAGIFQCVPLDGYRWNAAFNPNRLNKWTDLEITIASWLSISAGGGAGAGVGNGIGNTGAGTAVVLPMDPIPTPWTWESGQPGASFFASIDRHQTVTGTVSGIDYSVAHHLVATLTPRRYWTFGGKFSAVTGL